MSQRGSAEAVAEAIARVAGCQPEPLLPAYMPENADLMTYETPEGGRANRIWELPGSYQELVKRRAGLEAWTGLHGGFLGRAPDHVASCIAGFDLYALALLHEKRTPLQLLALALLFLGLTALCF